MRQDTNISLMYLDQSVLSRLQHDSKARPDVEWLLGKFADANAFFVFSRINVDECRAGTRAEEFIEILERIDARYVETDELGGNEVGLHANSARKLISWPEDQVDAIVKLSHDMPKILQFALGYLDDLTADQLVNEITDDLRKNWPVVDDELPPEVHRLFAELRDQVVNTIRALPIEKMGEEARNAQDEYIARLPANFAQLDEMPADTVVEYMLSLLGADQRNPLTSEYPKGFGRMPLTSYGKLSGFAFLMVVLGLVRPKKARNGSLHKRYRPFLAQVRDCQHIEHASRCAYFVTFDKGAARLASSVYSYAGCATKTIFLQTDKN